MTTPQNNALNRRAFLRRSVASVAGLSILGSKSLFANHAQISKGESFGVLVDLTRCISCRACSRACAEVNNLHPEDDGTHVSPEHHEEPVYNKWSTVNVIHGTKPDGSSFSQGVKRQCMHCLEPACVSVCPVGAMSQTEIGPVIYREDRCIGCRYCMVACPFEVPKFNWNSGLMPVIGKCQLCMQNRIVKGLQPGCVDACPTGTLKFGKREKLLFEAKVRIKASPDKYVNHIYGENEIGGTSWLYLSSVPFETLGFKSTLPSSPIPTFTWEVVSRLPVFVAVLSALFGTVAISLKKEHEQKTELSK